MDCCHHGYRLIGTVRQPLGCPYCNTGVTVGRIEQLTTEASPEYLRKIAPFTNGQTGLTDALNAAAARIAELEKENAALKAEREWVPVSDGWPEKGQLIVARAFAGWDESDPGWVEVFDGNRGGAEFESWMPLPEPPND